VVSRRILISLLFRVVTGYSKALASTAAVKGKTVQACLEVLHTDIVRVWNFQDPHHVMFIFRCFVVYADVAFGAVFGE